MIDSPYIMFASPKTENLPLQKRKKKLNTCCLFALITQRQEYRAKKGIALTEFKDLILRWVEKDLRLVLANKAAVAVLGAPLLAVTAKNAGRRVPRVGDAVDKVPTPLVAAVFSVGLLLLQDVRVGRQRE